MKQDPEIKDIMSIFSGISIHSITQIDQTSDQNEDIINKQEKLKEE